MAKRNDNMVNWDTGNGFSRFFGTMTTLIVLWFAFVAGVVGTLLYFGYKALQHFGVL